MVISELLYFSEELVPYLSSWNGSNSALSPEIYRGYCAEYK